MKSLRESILDRLEESILDRLEESILSSNNADRYTLSDLEKVKIEDALKICWRTYIIYFLSKEKKVTKEMEELWAPCFEYMDSLKTKSHRNHPYVRLVGLFDEWQKANGYDSNIPKDWKFRMDHLKEMEKAIEDNVDYILWKTDKAKL